MSTDIDVVLNININNSQMPVAKSLDSEGNASKFPPRKRKRIVLKAAVKIPLIIVGVLFGLFLLLAIFISPIAEYIIEKHSKEICHRIVTMDDLTINLFRGSVDIEGFKALEENDKDVFITFDELYVNMSLYRLLGKTVRLDEITLNSPDIVVVQNGKKFNFTDIIEFYKSDKPKDKDKKSPWEVDLRNIMITKGKIVYRDAQVKSKFDLRELAIAVPRIYFSTQKTDIGLDLKFADGGDLAVKLLYGLENNQYNLDVKLHNFALSSVTPYLTQFLNIHSFDGRLTTSLNIQGNMDHILDVVGKGDVSIANMYATDLHDKRIGKVDKLDVNIKNVDVKNKIYQLGNVTVNGLTTTYEQFAETHTFSNLVKGSQTDDAAEEKGESDSTKVKTEADPSARVKFSIDNIAVVNSAFTYIDHTMRQEATIPVKSINAQMQNFAMDNPLALKLNALIGETGELHADWTGSLSDFKNQTVNVFIKNVKLPIGSPYCMEYLSYPIEDGVLSLVSRSTIKDNIITSKNKVDIYNCVVGKKNKVAKPEYNIPLRAGIYVLSDRKGRIQFDLPITGDLSSPNFSYRKIIFKAIGNLLVKIVAAPFDLIAKSLGKDSDIFADIQYDIRPQGLGSEAADRLNKVADAMKEKPELVLTLQQSVDIGENMKAYALFNVKRDYFEQKNGRKPSLDEFEDVLKIKNTDAKFVDYVNSKAEPLHAVGDISQKCVAICGPEVVEAQVKSNIERRYQSVVNHFTTQGIPASRLKVLELGSKQTPPGKTLLSFGIDMVEE